MSAAAVSALAPTATALAARPGPSATAGAPDDAFATLLAGAGLAAPGIDPPAAAPPTTAHETAAVPGDAPTQVIPATPQAPKLVKVATVTALTASAKPVSLQDDLSEAFSKSAEAPSAASAEPKAVDRDTESPGDAPDDLTLKDTTDDSAPPPAIVLIQAPPTTVLVASAAPPAAPSTGPDVAVAPLTGARPTASASAPSELEPPVERQGADDQDPPPSARQAAPSQPSAPEAQATPSAQPQSQPPATDAVLTAAATQALPTAPPVRSAASPVNAAPGRSGSSASAKLATASAAGPARSADAAPPATADDVATVIAVAAAPAERGVGLADDEAPAPPEVAVQGGAPAQGAASTQDAAAAAPLVETRGSPDTVASFAAELVKRLDQQTSRFTVALNPNGLGRVDVSLKIARDGALSADISADSDAGAAALKSRSSDLTDALSQAGFFLAPDALKIDVAPATNTAFGFGAGASFADARGGQAGHRPTPSASRWSGADEALDLAASPLPFVAKGSARGLDIRI